MGSLAVSPEGLEASGEQFGQFAEQVQNALNSINNGIAGKEGGWGGDDMGKGFEEKYKPQRAYVIDGMTGAADLLTAISDAIGQMAHDYAHAEQISKDAGAQLSQTLSQLNDQLKQDDHPDDQSGGGGGDPKSGLNGVGHAASKG